MLHMHILLNGPSHKHHAPPMLSVNQSILPTISIATLTNVGWLAVHGPSITPLHAGARVWMQRCVHLPHTKGNAVCSLRT